VVSSQSVNQLTVVYLYPGNRTKACTVLHIFVRAPMSQAQSTQSAGPVRFLIFYSIIFFLLASLVAGGGPKCSARLPQQRMYSTIQYLSTGVSNLLQPAQAEVVLGQLSTHLASWVTRVKSSQVTIGSRSCVRMYQKSARIAGCH
jgi:hypothetical protein